MKKLFVTLFLSLGLVGSAYATDLIALATNGKVHENSLGVRTLNHQEMREIVGGAYLNPYIRKHYGVVDNSGRNIYYTAYYQVVLEARDNPYFNLGSDYYAAVATTYNFRTHKITSEVVKINKYNSSDVRKINFQDNVKDRIKGYSVVKEWIKLDKVNINFFK